ncbi:MAG: calpain family cysteine protease, partial [archaeon]|nr:calpain family cysteine protease [archaeon]
GEYVDKVNGPEQFQFMQEDLETGDKGLIKRLTWKRPCEVKKTKWNVFEGEIECDDISQGSLGDCYFLSGIAALAKYSGLIREKFRTKEYSDLGFYEVILFIDGEWQIVFLDDYFPFDPKHNDWEFAKPHENELWAMLLEKAWAKVNGGYSNIIAGFVAETWDAITGFPTERIKNNVAGALEVFNKIKKASSKGHLMSCGSKQNESIEKMALVMGHAYTILSGKDWPEENINLIQIRNPWGIGSDGEWKGAWSDKDKKNWSKPGAKEHFGYSDKDDGIFFMDYKDFTQYFDDTFICHLFFGSFIKTYFIDSDTQLKFPLVFNIKIKEQRKFSIAAKFKIQRFNRELHNIIHPFSMILFKYNEDRKIENCYSKHCALKDDSIVEKLDPGNYLLWVFCSHTECIMNDPYFKYKLLFYSKADYEVECVGVDKTFRLINHLLLENFKREGVGADKLRQNTDVVVATDPQLFKDGGMRAFLMYNKTNKWAKVNISGINTEDIHLVPPFEGQSSLEIMIPPKG